MARPKTAHRVLPAGDNWRMQYDRMQRSFARMKKTSTGSHSAEYDDAVYHFFQDVWHLKDWIANDPSLPVPAKVAISAAVFADKDLLAAGDFANGTKHFELHKKVHAGTRISKRESIVYVYLDRPAHSEQKHELDIRGRKTTAADLAQKAITKWDAILKSRKLL
jgi:hypothetical protein